MIFSHFYHTTAPNDQCTMYCDRNLINRRNVSVDVSKNVNATKQFVMLEINARIVAACMTELNIDEVDGKPSTSALPLHLTKSSKGEKRHFLKLLASRVVDKYILGEEKVTAILDKVHMAEKEEREKLKTKEGARFKCRFPGCDKTYRFDGKRKREHEASHGLSGVTEPITQYTDKLKLKRDDMFNYQSSLLEIGLLVKNFYDAISEGDGQRVIRCWKFMLQYLKQDGASSRKYALEALYIQCQVNSLLSPRAAHRLIWDRFFKSKSGAGGNIPLDLALEHFNRLIKILMRSLGHNGLNRKALDRYCKALATNKQLLDSFDGMCNITRRSGNHVRHSSENDLRKVVKGLIQNKAFVYTNGRTYKHFSGVKSSMLEDFNASTMFKWINEHKKNVYLNRCAN